MGPVPPTEAAPPLPLLAAPRLEGTGCARAAFTTRRGGVSAGPFASLNLSYGVGDAAGAVRENRRRLCLAWGASPGSAVEGAQVHGRRVAIVGRAEAGGVVPEADALVTDTPDVWLAVHAADCVPLLLVDPERPAVGALHAGWRGAAAGIVRVLVDVMRARFAARPERVRAALGPAIGPCCYEVDVPVARAMDGRPWWPEAATQTRPGRWRLDLRAAIIGELRASGVPAGSVEVVGGCTACEREQFFSYRRDGTTGRLAGCIRLRE